MLNTIAPRGSHSSAAEVHTATSQRDIEALADDWRRLEAEANAPAFFQSYDWTRLIAETRRSETRSANEEGTTRVLVVRDGDGLAAIWPLRIARHFGGRFATDLGEPFGQYSDALAVPGPRGDAALDEAFETLRRTAIDGLILGRVRADARVAEWLKHRAKRIGESRTAPAVDLSQFSSFDDYKASIKSKTRKNLRNYRNRLARLGNLTHRVVEDAQEARDLTLKCLDWRAAWLADSGQSSRAFQDPLFLQLVRNLADPNVSGPPLRMMLLELVESSHADTTPQRDVERPAFITQAGGEPVAIQWGFDHQGRYYAFMSAKNPRFDSFSPGRLHLEDVIGCCAEHGIEVVDMLAPDMPYKSTWATERVPVESWVLATTLRGRLIADVWHDFARPALKSALYRMPVGLRRRLLDRGTQTAGEPARITNPTASTAD